MILNIAYLSYEYSYNIQFKCIIQWPNSVRLRSIALRRAGKMLVNSTDSHTSGARFVSRVLFVKDS
jgi:hypothetical protein